MSLVAGFVAFKGNLSGKAPTFIGRKVSLVKIKFARMKKYVLCMALLGACVACSSDEPNASQVELNADCEYETRKTVSTITNQKGTIKVTTTGTDTWTDIYLEDGSSTPYCACNLPASFSVEGKRVVFSAEVKETYPNEKWRCQPIKLTALAPGSATEK